MRGSTPAPRGLRGIWARVRDLLGWDGEGRDDALSLGLPRRQATPPWQQASQGIALVAGLAAVVIVVGLVVAAIAAALF